MGCCEAFKELFYYRSVRCSCICRYFFTLIEVYSKSLFKNPNDYKEFLLQHNGMEMFDGIELLSTEGIIDYNEVLNFSEGYVLNIIMMEDMSLTQTDQEKD